MRVQRVGFSFDSVVMEQHYQSQVERCRMWLCPGCRVEDHAKHEPSYRTSSGLTGICQCEHRQHFKGGSTVKMKIERKDTLDPNSGYVVCFANGLIEKVFESSVGLTVALTKKWENQKLLAILASEGISLPLDTEQSDLQRAVASFLQIAWYEAFGTTDPKVPDKVRVSHEARIQSYSKGEGTMTAAVKAVKAKTEKKAVEKAKAQGKPVAKKEPKAETVYTFKKAPETQSGQFQLVLDVFSKLKKGTLEQITQAVVKTGKLKTKQDPRFVVGFRIKELVGAGNATTS